MGRPLRKPIRDKPTTCGSPEPDLCRPHGSHKCAAPPNGARNGRLAAIHETSSNWSPGQVPGSKKQATCGEPHRGSMEGSSAAPRRGRTKLEGRVPLSRWKGHLVALVCICSISQVFVLYLLYCKGLVPYQKGLVCICSIQSQAPSDPPRPLDSMCRFVKKGVFSSGSLQQLGRGSALHQVPGLGSADRCGGTPQKRSMKQSAELGELSRSKKKLSGILNS